MFLDIYIVYVGMIVAVLLNRTTQLRTGSVVSKMALDGILQAAISFRRASKTAMFLISLGLIPGFWIITRRSPNKENYNCWIPFVSFIPILSFITLRNSHRLLRNHHSRVFAWLGRCSLETYILQYHIWLAGDTKGLLRLGLWNPWVETAMLTAIFLWLSWLMAGATRAITSAIVGTKPANECYSDDDTVGPKYSPYLLPKMEDGEGTPSKDMRFDIGRSNSSRWMEKFFVRFSEDLRWRLGLIFLVMWVANITYK